MIMKPTGLVAPYDEAFLFTQIANDHGHDPSDSPEAHGVEFGDDPRLPPHHAIGAISLSRIPKPMSPIRTRDAVSCFQIRAYLRRE